MAGVALKGILADPEAVKRRAASLEPALAGEGRRLVGLVQARAPILTGELRAAVRSSVKTVARKGKNPFVKLVVDADRATRKGAKGDPPKRYGRVPYGVFVDHRTDFLRGTVNAEEPNVLRAVDAAVRAHVLAENTRFPAPKTARR